MESVHPVAMDVIRARLREHAPLDLYEEPAARAAVALVLQEGASGPEFLAIRRSERPGDPWSGHMALPGGRMDRSDASLAATAIRETFEEVGIDLRHGSVRLGKLDDIRATSRGRSLDLIISPFAFALDSSRTPIPNPREVQEAFWIPLRLLFEQDPRNRASTGVPPQRTVHGFPAFVHDGNSIWGLTYRILETLLDVLRGDGRPRAPHASH